MRRNLRPLPILIIAVLTLIPIAGCARTKTETVVVTSIVYRDATTTEPPATDIDVVGHLECSGTQTYHSDLSPVTTKDGFVEPANNGYTALVRKVFESPELDPLGFDGPPLIMWGKSGDWTSNIMGSFDQKLIELNPGVEPDYASLNFDFPITQNFPAVWSTGDYIAPASCWIESNGQVMLGTKP